MCGIAALLPTPTNDPNADPIHRRVLDDALERLAHRGPDGSGVHRTESQVLLGHRRLAVIDPRGGRQPLLDSAGDALVANGMIYNDRALRAQMSDVDYTTGSDSESILHLMRRHGPDAVDRLDGMFAFVYSAPDRIIAARDPLGIKPLYRFRLGDTEAFASEVKAFDGLATDVTEFPAGHVYDSRHGLRRYYHLPHPELDVSDADPREALGELRRVLDAAVAKRLRSDVPFGALLSGGLDSSLVCALARRHVDELHTFAVGLPGSPDLAAARRVAAHLDTVHHELVVSEEDVLDAVPDVLWHLESSDVDLVRSAVATWLIMRFAAEHVTVVLTGEGADELFAGYRYHREYDDPELLHAELRRSLLSMHNVNLQRVDRMSMAHGVEARVPFLDRTMLDTALRIHPRLKSANPHTGEAMEKWALRAIASDLLPEDVVWRRKAQFDEGSGMAGILPRLAPSQVDAVNVPAAEAEAMWYRELLDKHFVRPDHVHSVAGTWASDRLG